MLQSNILEILYKKYKHLNEEDIDNIFEIFKRKITESLDEGRKIEIRGFGTISKKINKEKYVRNPKTNKVIFKKQTYKLHFKIGKLLHRRLNPKTDNET